MGALVMMSTAAAANINCHRDTAPAERIICANDDLLRMDERMSTLYFRLNNDVRRPVARRLLDNQRDWLYERNQCRSARCLRDMYRERIEALESALD
jgi:uncharacterized protein